MAVRLMKTIIPFKKHVTALCSFTFPLYNHLSLRIPFFRSGDKKNIRLNLESQKFKLEHISN